VLVRVMLVWAVVLRMRYGHFYDLGFNLFSIRTTSH
jgi:hypothetical protein